MELLSNTTTSQALSEFVQTPVYAAQYASHIKYDQLTHTVVSRALIDTRNLAFGQERLFLQQIKTILSLPHMHNVTAYHPSFQLGEQQVVKE